MTDFNRVTCVAVFVLLLSTLVGESDAAQNGRRQRYSSKQRAAIRAMPILERPSRPGHFYGNTVRRNAASKSKQSSVVAKQRVVKPAVTQPNGQQAIAGAKLDPSRLGELPTEKEIITTPEADGPIVPLQSKLSLADSKQQVDGPNYRSAAKD